MEERLQKILARAGLGSRRACEKLIEEGHIRINGKKATLGEKVDPTKVEITCDGRVVEVKEEEKVYIALYKPKGVLSDVGSKDPRPNVRSLVPNSENLFCVGRLDLNSEGLILLTNDGELTNRLTHPRYGHEKEYRVLVNHRPDEEQLNIWRRGVVLPDGYKTKPADVKVEFHGPKGTWLRIILKEGKKRQIRETGLILGLPVKRLIRVRIGEVELGTLKAKEWRHLKPREVERLKRIGSNRKK
jgi:23S rRNA pseudouridine2605 synthase